MDLTSWLTLACEHCTKSFTVDEAIKVRGRCPDCHIPIRPVIAILLDAAAEWEDQRLKFSEAERRIRVVH